MTKASRPSRSSAGRKADEQVGPAARRRHPGWRSAPSMNEAKTFAHAERGKTRAPDLPRDRHPEELQLVRPW